MELGSELTALVSTAAGQMMNLIATDGWAAAKSAVLSLWRRSHPQRVEEDLNQAREDLLAAQESGTDAQLREVLVAEWQARLARLLLSQPDLADELSELLAGALSDHGSRGRWQTAGSTTLTAHVSGGGDAYMAGRDMTITRETPTTRTELA
jgi:hypothetical protein